jgi:hypothetical protein
MSIRRSTRAFRGRRLVVEAVASGLAYGAGLCWASTCLVASFRVADLAMPYWSAIRGLRTDTCGAAAFIVAAVTLAVSEYLRLGRGGRFQRVVAPSGTAWQRAAIALAEAAAVMSTGLVAYLSINAVTHPVTLGMPATHFASWPTEGTLRVLALAVCVAAVGALRYLRARNVADADLAVQARASRALRADSTGSPNGSAAPESAPGSDQAP